MLTTDQMVPKPAFMPFSVIMQQFDKATLKRRNCTHQHDADLSVQVVLCPFRVVIVLRNYGSAQRKRERERESVGLLVSNS